MSERRSQGSEMRMNRAPSPEADWSDFSSSSSSVSYSSKITIEDNVQYGKALEIKPMPLVGCPRCYMYVMLSEEDPKCPSCKSTVFLDLFREENFKTDNSGTKLVVLRG